MLQFILEIPESISLKEKRRVVKSLKDRLHQKFKLSVAAVDLHDSLKFSQIGVVLVSNSRKYGESVLNKAIDFIEANARGRLADVKIFSEFY